MLSEKEVKFIRRSKKMQKVLLSLGVIILIVAVSFDIFINSAINAKMLKEINQQVESYRNIEAETKTEELLKQMVFIYYSCFANTKFFLYVQ